MKNFIIIILTSLIVFVLFRMVLLLIYAGLKRVIKGAQCVEENFSLSLSVSFFLVYIQGFIGAVEGVTLKQQLTNLEWYFVYVCMGIIAVIWCYCKWTLTLKERPRINRDKRQVALKKVIIFSCVMAFSFVVGFNQMKNILYGYEVDTLLLFVNVTIIPGVIALDRVMNQIHTIFSEK